MRTPILLLLCYVVAALAPSRGHSQVYTFQDIAWGSSPSEVGSRLISLGYKYDKPSDTGSRNAAHQFLSADGARVFARFFDGTLASLNLRYSVPTPQRAVAFYEQVRDSLQRFHGFPSKIDSTSTYWIGPDTRTGTSLDSVRGMHYVWISHEGPLGDEWITAFVDSLGDSAPASKFPDLSPRWHVLHIDGEGRAAIDTDTQLGGEGTRLVWVRWDYSEDRTETSKGKTVRYDARMTRQEFDCRGRRTRIADTVLYLDGKVVHTFDPTFTNWSSLLPETVGEAILEGVCSR